MQIFSNWSECLTSSVSDKFSILEEQIFSVSDQTGICKIEYQISSVSDKLRIWTFFIRINDASHAHINSIVDTAKVSLIVDIVTVRSCLPGVIDADQ